MPAKNITLQQKRKQVVRSGQRGTHRVFWLLPVPCYDLHKIHWAIVHMIILYICILLWSKIFSEGCVVITAALSFLGFFCVFLALHYNYNRNRAKYSIHVVHIHNMWEYFCPLVYQLLLFFFFFSNSSKSSSLNFRILPNRKTSYKEDSAVQGK